MKLLTFEVSSCLGKISRVGAEINGQIVDLNLAGEQMYLLQGEGDPKAAADYFLPCDMLKFLQRGNRSMEAAREVLAFVEAGNDTAADGTKLLFDFDKVKILAPVKRPNIILDSTLFAGHVMAMTKSDTVPDVFYRRPVWCTQSPSVVVGTGASILKPSYTNKLDFELEFGVFVGKKGINISMENAMSYVAGFTIFNDISARDATAEEKPMLLGYGKGKVFEHSSIMGPCIVTPDEIGNYRDLHMRAYVNGKLVADDYSGDMTHGVEKVIEVVSRDCYIYPGDFLALGTTPSGTTQCSTLKRWLEVGDTVCFEVEKIGRICNTVEQA